MRTLANILWHVPFLGFVSALLSFLLGSLLLITVVAAPIGLGLIQLSRFLLTPFSSVMVKKIDVQPKGNVLWHAYGFIVRVLYFPLGLVLALITVAQIVCLCASIIGIPVAIVLAKSLGTFFNPVNKVCVHRTVAQAAQLRNAQAQIR